MSNLHFAVISGLCAATASTCGKLSGLSEFQGYLFVARIIFFISMLICNAAVWTFFAKALQRSDSLTATAVSSATNYLFSALSGYFLFGEITSLLWWTGMFFIIAGLLLILSDQAEDVNKEEKKAE